MLNIIFLLKHSGAIIFHTEQFCQDLTGDNSLVTLKKVLRKYITQKTGDVEMKKPWENFSGVDRLYEPSLKRDVQDWVMLFPGLNLCSWYLKSKGGCSMCGFNGSASSKQEYAWLTKYFGGRALHAMYWLGYWGARKQNPERLTIYNGGNFLNTGKEVPGQKPEIPFSLQKTICRHVRTHRTIQKLFVESRPEFITSENIPLLKGLLGEKTLEVGIGLESSNDHIRNGVLKKGTSLAAFERAVATLREYGAKSLAYVFLKPIGLDDAAAVTDAIATIRYCFEVAHVDEVSLSCAFIQEGTGFHKAYEDGTYKPPTLWSITRVIEQTANLGPVRVGTFEDDPPPIDVPKNCPECTDRVNKALDQYRHSFDPTVFDGLSCPCK